MESGGVATTALLKSWMDHYQTCCDGRVVSTIGDRGGTQEKQKKGLKRDKENGGGGRRVQLDGDIVCRSHLMVLRERPIRAVEEAVNRVRGDAAVKRLIEKWSRGTGRKY
jgi:hypothetical protein